MTIWQGNIDMMMTQEHGTPCLIGLDWGTSSLRAWLLDDTGQILATRQAAQGIMQITDGDFAGVFRALITPWIDTYGPLPAIACGMIGSRGGWVEADYVDCPVTPGWLAGQLLRVAAEPVALHIVPGVRRCSAPGCRPDVMRGEETQVLGGLATRPELSERGLLVMPGTHSKWVMIREGQLADFNTYMTGELFAVLRQHSILGRPDEFRETEFDAPAFALGVDTAREAGCAGLSAALFSVRSRMLAGEISRAATRDYLSGLLIGDELRSALAQHTEVPALCLIGDEALCARYRRALSHFGVHDITTIADAASRGLWRIAESAGLLNKPED